MQKTQKTYTPEFKREAVRLAQTSGRPIAHLGRSLGISDTSIHQWRKELAEHGSEAFPGSGHQTALEEENRRRQQRIGAHAPGTRYTKKNYSYLLARPAVRYQAIEMHREEYPICVLCEALEVSESGYSAWRKRPMSQHQQEDHQLAKQIQETYIANRQVYGSPRLHVELREQGISCSRRRVARLMREMGLSPHRPRQRRLTTHRDPSARVAANLLDRHFLASRPNEKWAGDITAIWTLEGWLAPFGGT